MSGRGRGAGSPTPRTASIVAAALLGLAAVGCGPAEEPGAADAPAGDTAARPGTEAPAAGAPDTVGAAPAPDTADDTEAPAVDQPADTAAAPARGDTAPAADTVTRRWVPGGYMVYVRRGESPDSVAADHGVRPDTVLADLPGFYARLTADQAGSLARDERVRQLARQLEERPAREPRTIPSAPDTGGGG